MSLDSPRRRTFGDQWEAPRATPPGKKRTMKIVFTRRRVAVNVRRKEGRDGDSR